MNAALGMWVVVETLVDVTVCHVKHLGTRMCDGYRPVASFAPCDETDAAQLKAFLEAEEEARRLNFNKALAQHDFEQAHVYNAAYWYKGAQA